MRTFAALLATALAVMTPDGRAQLLPFGEFAALDGRPGPGKTWKLDDAAGERLAAKVNAITAATPIVIDYDHQTLRAEFNGAKAPAAGWVLSVEWLSGKGLFANVEWTATAKDLIAAREYRYISPVITSAADGTVTGVLLGALVNNPALRGMEPAMAQLAAQLNPEEPENRMDKAKLIKLLGLKAEATDADVEAAITALSTRPMVPQALSTALGLQANADEAAALAAVTTLKAGDATAAQTIAALHSAVTQLQADARKTTLTAMVDDALKQNKLIPAMKTWALSQTPEALKAYLDTAPTLPLGVTQSTAANPGNGDAGTGFAALSNDARRVAETMGVSPKAYDDRFKKAA